MFYDIRESAGIKLIELLLKQGKYKVTDMALMLINYLSN